MLKRIWSYWPHAALLIFAVLVAYAISRTTIYQTCYASHKEYASYQQEQEGFFALKWVFRNLKVWLKCAGNWADHSHGLLTAIATFAIAAFTWTLWRATGRLWRATNDTLEHSRETAQRELRAYVGHYGAPFEGPVEIQGSTPVAVGPAKYFEWNYGRTPAFAVSMYARIVDGDAPAKLDDELLETERQDVMAHLPPNQNLGKIISVPDGRGPYTYKSHFFLYGHVNYTDIFGVKWRRRFAFSHDPKRQAAGGEAYQAHGSHNDELCWDEKTKKWKTYIPQRSA
jgi:hypothetical protein